MSLIDKTLQQMQSPIQNLLGNWLSASTKANNTLISLHF